MQLFFVKPCEKKIIKNRLCIAKEKETEREFTMGVSLMLR
jgi:hypothetical protein